MLEEGESVEHRIHGECVVLKAWYLDGEFKGADLRPTTDEGRLTLQQCSLNKTGNSYEPDKHLIIGA